MERQALSPTQTATQGKPVIRVLCFVTLMSHDCWQAKGHIFLSFRRVTEAKYRAGGTTPVSQAMA